MTVRAFANDAFRDFSNNELLLLLDATNASVYDPDLVKIPATAYILATAKDAMRIDKLDTKWGVDATLLMDKLRELTELKAFELLVRLDCAWRNHKGITSDAQWIATAFARPVDHAAEDTTAHSANVTSASPASRCSSV